MKVVIAAAVALAATARRMRPQAFSNLAANVQNDRCRQREWVTGESEEAAAMTNLRYVPANWTASNTSVGVRIDEYA